MADSNEHAIANAKAWLANVQEMVGRLVSEDGAISDAAREEIEQSPLSVLVRDGWRLPGEKAAGPEEYEILLTTGGPALRITGAVEDGETPDYSPRLQWQDWGTPWTDYRLTGDEESDLAAFARCFYFGEA